MRFFADKIYNKKGRHKIKNSTFTRRACVNVKLSKNLNPKKCDSIQSFFAYSQPNICGKSSPMELKFG